MMQFQLQISNKPSKHLNITCAEKQSSRECYSLGPGRDEKM